MKTEQTKFAVLGGPNQATLDPKAFYLIDFDKVESLDDLKRILAAIGFNIVGNHPRIAMVADLLQRDNPLYPPEEITTSTTTTETAVKPENEDGGGGL